MAFLGKSSVPTGHTPQTRTVGGKVYVICHVTEWWVESTETTVIRKSPINVVR